MTLANNKPRIAIPMPTSSNASYNERCWPQYASAIEAFGGEAVCILLELVPAEAAKLISSCAGALLPGSPADVHPQKYGQESHEKTALPDRPREAMDELLLQDTFNLQKPLLGICFGLQMMNVWRGGTLVQHLEASHLHAPGLDEAPVSHGLTLQPETHLLRSFFLSQSEPQINSSHHQSIDVAGDGLTVAALSEDGVIEALEGSALSEQFVLGVQWHPERSYENDEPSRAIFMAFIQAARDWHLPHA